MTIRQKPILHGRDHCPGGADPIPCLMPSGGDLDDIIASIAPDAFWKLDEASGSTAHDSSGNGHDLVASGGFGPPSWGAPAGPPGTTSAHFHTSASDTRLAATLTGMTDNFTAGIWVNDQDITSGAPSELLGQGTPVHGSGSGWSLGIGTYKFTLGVGGTVYPANNAHAQDVWYFLALVRDAGTWKLYVNGLLQAASATTSPGSGYGGNTWIGNDAFASHSTFTRNALLSYGFIASRVLSGSELVAMYEAGVSPGAGAGSQVLVSDGAGGFRWGQANGDAIADESIENKHVAAAADIAPTKLAHPGGTTTFLRGDGTWVAPPSGSVATDTLFDAKGDLAAGTGADTAARLAVGSNGQLLSADSTASTGLKWVAAPAYDPATATKAWMPLVDDPDGTCVLDSSGALIPTLITL